MRQFDNFDSYLDNLGNPLVGRLVFKKVDGSAAVIYDCNDKALPNPVFTDSSGRTSTQVFLDDHDYLVYFEKYVGASVMVDDDELDAWEIVGSTINRYNTVGVDVKVDGGVFSVDTIADLKSLDPATKPNYVNVLGYNSAGDKPQIQYVWKTGSSKSDDGGSVIGSSVQGANGRWLIVPSFDKVDVRHFGAFPKSVATADTTQVYAIQYANIYAEKLGMSIYMFGDNIDMFYDVSGMDLYKVETSDKVRLFIDSDDDTTINNVTKVYARGNVDADKDGVIILKGQYLKTSFDEQMKSSVQLVPAESIEFDTNYTRRLVEFKGVEVILTINQTRNAVQYKFENCTFSGKGTLPATAAMTFIDCRIKQSMFANFDSGNMMFTNCVTDINQWSDMSKFIDCMMDMGNNDIDFYGRTVSGDYTFIGKDFTIRNAKFTGTVTCKNFKCVNCYVEKAIATTYDIVDSDVSVGGNIGSYGSTSLPSGKDYGFYAYNSTIRLYDNAWFCSFTSMTKCIVPSYGAGKTIYFYPILWLTKYRIQNVSLRENKIGCQMKFTTAGYGVTPYEWGSDGSLVDNNYKNVYVDNFDCVDNSIFNPNSGNTGAAAVEPIIIDKNLKPNFDSDQGSYEFKRNYEYSSHLKMLETDLDVVAIGYEGECQKIPFATIESSTANGLHVTDQICLKRFIYCFGEDTNSCSYGFDKLNANNVRIEWTETGASGYYDAKESSGLDYYGGFGVDVRLNGRNRLDKSFVNGEYVRFTSGTAGATGAHYAKVSFTPIRSNSISYNFDFNSEDIPTT